MPCRATRPGALSRPRPPSRWPCASGNPAPVFCPACSEAIFTVPLLTPVSHPHRLAGAFPEQLLSSSWHLLSVTFFLIYHYNLVDFCLSSRILVFCERIFCGFFCHYFHGQARPGRTKGAGQAVEILGMTREAPASRLLQLSCGWYMIVKIQECRTRQKRGAYGQTESHPDDRPV